MAPLLVTPQAFNSATSHKIYLILLRRSKVSTKVEIVWKYRYISKLLEGVPSATRLLVQRWGYGFACASERLRGVRKSPSEGFARVRDLAFKRCLWILSSERSLRSPKKRPCRNVHRILRFVLGRSCCTLLLREALRPRPHVSGYFWILSGYGFHPHASVNSAYHFATFESALRSRNFWIRSESGIVWTLNPDIFSYPVT